MIESNFHRSVASADIRRLPGRVVEVLRRCEPAVAIDRYRRRVGTRHAGHFDGVRMPGDLWNEEVAEPVAGGWPVFEANTNRPVDIAKVLAFVRRSTE
ncbi:MAG: hypothetical protein ACRD1K_04685 [Acidimicrobiales bacterium]